MVKYIIKYVGYIIIITLAIILCIAQGGFSNPFGLFIIALFTTLVCTMWGDYMEEWMQ